MMVEFTDRTARNRLRFRAGISGDPPPVPQPEFFAVCFSVALTLLQVAAAALMLRDLALISRGLR